MDEFLQQAVDWFIKVKAPDLKVKVEAGMESMKSHSALEGNYKELFGFLLFSYAMNFGQTSFLEVEKAATEIGVLTEFEGYARHWIGYSKFKSL